ncbi:hypothetical protein K437DRAFT_89022 [Tilletiaria anomala UBC 951]|uniref:Uncharacterized protein n=1 Tax=Tilletiaria anomala (strain ATCC 24038 / CBS 436.72 / UBC 951) TaxID=1037660 RepID=A0A066W3D2_TILAU|nr:uncharacterized protein K437DRAFT_89022 [Tilletiaria anomala UBC 951]KDN48231.1 hypothetical protein K437DRAFT_89022 [Tilletiaria anomala UBC 951]
MEILYRRRKVSTNTPRHGNGAARKPSLYESFNFGNHRSHVRIHFLPSAAKKSGPSGGGTVIYAASNPVVNEIRTAMVSPSAFLAESTSATQLSHFLDETLTSPCRAYRCLSPVPPILHPDRAIEPCGILTMEPMPTTTELHMLLTKTCVSALATHSAGNAHTLGKSALQLSAISISSSSTSSTLTSISQAVSFSALEVKELRTHSACVTH